MQMDRLLFNCGKLTVIQFFGGSPVSFDAKYAFWNDNLIQVGGIVPRVRDCRQEE
jgi:hypothetical protein